jgi:hypothetical protein
MGNAWLDFLAEERDKEENKDVPPMELSSHVRPKYDAWKEANGIESKSADKMEDKVEDKMEEEVEVVVVAKKMKKGKSVKKGRKGKSVKKGKKGKRRGTRKR